MENIPTMAMKITKNTYPIAVACLPAGFATYAFEEIRNCYVVINEPQPQQDIELGGGTLLVIANSWRTERRFQDAYEFVGEEKKEQFTKVKKKPRPVIGRTRRVTYNSNRNRIND